MLSAKVREKSIGKMSSMRLLAVLLVPVVALIMGAAVPEVLAWGGWGDWGDCEELPLEAKIIFETNFTDNDTGIQVFADGDPWKKLMIIDPDGDLMFNISTWGSLRHFGLAELFSESNEPNWTEDMSHSEILGLFDEGIYKFFARSIEGEWLKGCAELSKDLPCAPTGLSPSNVTVLANGILLEWDHVTQMLVPFDDVATCSGGDIDVETYQVIVENLETENQFSIFVEAPPDGDTQVTLPPEFVENGVTYKWEVLAIADNGNQTIAEAWFCTGDVGDPCPEPGD
ncbi:MAG: hypothetical protein JSV31_04700 [Desulfobacterales bacterium]|nr:MAG: hypothetical protein JSV31_04700 [Desulfobacterales bacterium]